MRYLAISLTLFLTMALPWRANAGEPTVQLSTTINEFVTILVSTPVSELRSTGLPEKALKLIYGRFDFSEMTKRSLAGHWKTLEQSEQREFVDAFTQKLLVVYGRTVRASLPASSRVSPSSTRCGVAVTNSPASELAADWPVK